MSEKKHEMYIAGVKAAMDLVRNNCYATRHDPHYKADPVYTLCIKKEKFDTLEKQLLED